MTDEAPRPVTVSEWPTVEYQRGRAEYLARMIAAVHQAEDTAADPYQGGHRIAVPRLAPDESRGRWRSAT